MQSSPVVRGHSTAKPVDWTSQIKRTSIALHKQSPTEVMNSLNERGCLSPNVWALRTQIEASWESGQREIAYSNVRRLDFQVDLRSWTWPVRQQVHHVAIERGLGYCPLGAFMQQCLDGHPFNPNELRDAGLMAWMDPIKVNNKPMVLRLFNGVIRLEYCGPRSKIWPTDTLMFEVLG